MDCVVCCTNLTDGHCSQCQYSIPPNGDNRAIAPLLSRLQKIKKDHGKNCEETLEIHLAKGEKLSVNVINCDKCDFVTTW